jgi:hypothetical protein
VLDPAEGQARSFITALNNARRTFYLLHFMHTIVRCAYLGDKWERLERVHLPFGFDTEAAAVAYAENLNKQKWPGFDWCDSPQEAFLALKD